MYRLYPTIYWGKAQPAFALPLDDLGSGAVNTTPMRGSGSATFTRATTATTFDVSGNLVTVGTGVARSYYDPVSHVYLGYLAEEARTQFLGVTGTPATQTTSSLATGAYVLWVVGSGSATSSAGTATITGAGAATAGSPNFFTVTVAGTVTVTVSGSLTRFQLEKGAFATTYIPNAAAAGTTATRNADVLTYLTSGNMDGTNGTAYCEATWATQASGTDLISAFTPTSGIPMNMVSATIHMNDGADRATGAVISATAATAQKLATKWAGSACNGFANGVAGTGATFDGDLNIGASMGLMVRPNSTSWPTGTIKNVRIYARALSDAQLISLTT